MFSFFNTERYVCWEVYKLEVASQRSKADCIYRLDVVVYTERNRWEKDSGKKRLAHPCADSTILLHNQVNTERFLYPPHWHWWKILWTTRWRARLGCMWITQEGEPCSVSLHQNTDYWIRAAYGNLLSNNVGTLEVQVFFNRVQGGRHCFRITLTLENRCALYL